MPKIMSDKIKLAILFGGQSCEHAVSVASARSVLAAIDTRKYQLILIGISEAGHWQYAPDGDFASLIENNKVKPGSGIKIAPDLGNAGGLVALSAPPPKTSPPEINLPKISLPKMDVVFPLLHGTFGEDGAVQGLLELANVAYVGCPLSAAACGMDKIIAKSLFNAADIPQAAHVAIAAKQWARDPNPPLAQCAAQLTYPLFIKPANMGSSVGISKAHNRAALAKAIDLAFSFDEKVLVESAFVDCAEIECAVLGNENPTASVVGEITTAAAFYDYAAKYLNAGSKVHIPAAIPAQAAARVRELAITAFQAIQGKGLARVDFFVSRSSGEVWLNEINTMPGFTPISMYPKLWAASGVPYAALINRLVQLALQRHALKKSLKRAY